MGYYVGNENIYGKTVIITGCNTGIGKETAKVLAKKGTFLLFKQEKCAVYTVCSLL